MNKSRIFTFVFTVFASTVFAQNAITITDHKTGKPIEGVMAQVSFPSGKNEVFISNKMGQISTPIKPPYSIKLSHISYHGFSKNIESNTQLSFTLTPKSIVLDDIVVTGQYQPQSASNSVYKVRTVNETTIKSMGAVQLADVLSRQMNIRISPDLAIGSSSMTLQGIPGKNVKILVDGVPMVNRNGNGNDADLSQINMANVERIEIVEGPMAVNYGANALAGVVNIITKKAEPNTFRIGVDLQGETIDNAYSLNDGITNFNITSGFSLPKSFLLSVNGGATRFAGYKGVETGRKYEWNPKDQYFYDATLTYKTDKLSVDYKFDSFNEKIDDLDSIKYETHQATGAIRPYGIDKEYKSTRFGHQIQSDFNLADFNRLNVVLSYSKFSRKKRTFKNYLDNSEEIEFTSAGSSDTTEYSVFIARSTFQQTNPNNFLNYQAGFDINLESTSGGRIKDNQVQEMNDYAAFGSVELNPGEKWKIRPGIRFSYNSNFSSSIVPSLNLKYIVNKQLSIGAAYGRGYRAPSLRELYFEFIDSNHNIIGNENLTPEYANHFDANITHKWNKTTVGLKSNVSLFYNDITDLIGLGFDVNDPTFATYFNLGNLKTIGGNLNETFMWGHLTLGVGVGVVGRKEQDEEINTPDEFLFSPETSIDLSYIERVSQINISLFYKYNGVASRYLVNANNEVIISKVDGYSLLDLTLNRNIFKNTNLTIGAKNILDVKTLNSSATTTGGVHSGGSTINIGYGRSYFAKISFNLNSNK